MFTRRKLLFGIAYTTAVSGFLYSPLVLANSNYQLPLPPLKKSFLSPAERKFVAAAVNSLIPNDELGVGGEKAGIVDFIDHQLAGSFGKADRWYMVGPWQEGTDEQGFQLKLNPSELYRTAISEINQTLKSSYNGKVFMELEDSVKHEILTKLEDDGMGIKNGKMFFKMLLANAKEGFFADPMYGGNVDFAGWKLIGFPGARYNYSPYIEKHGEVFPHPPVGILGRSNPVRKGA